MKYAKLQYTTAVLILAALVAACTPIQVTPSPSTTPTAGMTEEATEEATEEPNQEVTHERAARSAATHDPFAVPVSTIRTAFARGHHRSVAGTADGRRQGRGRNDRLAGGGQP